jgi:hypothetical protein
MAIVIAGVSREADQVREIRRGWPSQEKEGAST